jgi:Protein of unknown function (DUF2905)
MADGARPWAYDGGVGRTLIVIGLVIVAVGLIMTLGDKLPIKLGRLPGDIVIRGKNSVFYFPIVTSVLLSAILTLVMWLFHRH